MGDDCRFDLDNPPRAGVTQFLAKKGNPMAESGAQGCIFWGLQGWSTRGAMYRPDFDQFPDAILAHIPQLVGRPCGPGASASGLLARPAEIVIPMSRRPRTGRPAHPLDRSRPDGGHVEPLRTGPSTWVLRSSYLDSFGTDPDDVNIMRQLREHMVRKGVDVPTYTEFTFDTLLPYSGFYTELALG